MKKLTGYLHVVYDWVGKDYRDCVHEADTSFKADDDKKLRRKQSIAEYCDWSNNHNEKSMSIDDGERKFISEQYGNTLLRRDSRTGADRMNHYDDEDTHKEKR